MCSEAREAGSGEGAPVGATRLPIDDRVSIAHLLTQFLWLDETVIAWTIAGKPNGQLLGVTEMF